MKKYTPEEYKKKFGVAAYVGSLQQSSAMQEQKASFGDRVRQQQQQGIESSKETLFNKTRNPISGGMKLGMGLLQTVSAPISAALQPAVEPTVGKVINKTADWISNDKNVQKFATSKAGEFTARRAEDVANFTGLAATVGGSKYLTGEVAPKISGMASNLATKTEQFADKARQGVQTTKNVVQPFIEEAKRIPDRLRTNVAQKQAVQETINQLPSKVAREAAQDGLDVGDIKTLYNIPKDQVGSLKKLATNVKQFSEGKTKTNPIEVVGKPIVNRLKELEQARTKVGGKLGEVADNLGVVTREELFPQVFQKLKKVPGLEGLEVSDKGVLNFKNTVLATAETATDRSAIQRIFNSATKWGQGKNKHLLRQELFEALGGKRRAGLNLTATQEKAYEAIRQGLSDVLESKNVGYKNLSNQYRQIISPLKEMRKMMKVAGETDDVLDMSAGLLARRLTSMAQSNPQIRAILNAMDKATKKAGKTRLNVETLQDFYNILEKYYDIAPKTGFQAQVRQGVEKAASGPINYLGEQIKGFAGETPIVRQRALEKILNEILGD